MKARLSTPFDSLAASGPAPVGVAAMRQEPGARLGGKQIAAEIAMRAFAVFLFSMFVSGAIHAFLKDPSRLTIILLVISETLTMGLAVCTRIPRERDWHAFSVLVAGFASFYFIFFSMAPGVRLVPEWLAAGLQIIGMVIQIGAKLTLRRSYGILPANRGVVIGGPYRVVRHPIYLGYFIYNTGFLLPSFGLQNLVVLMGLWSMQLMRVVREERVLRKDPTYSSYMQRVRYRLIPGVF